MYDNMFTTVKTVWSWIKKKFKLFRVLLELVYNQKASDFLAAFCRYTLNTIYN